uniref:Methyl-CpG-binding domain protein 2-like n=1 Tax=Tursiops truncatus TaxID=9739 RepID=A0A6J3PWX0_TURTR|nr:methyl-CpG-binding domain protein 2-like [Tursiops truncatus]
MSRNFFPHKASKNGGNSRAFPSPYESLVKDKRVAYDPADPPGEAGPGRGRGRRAAGAAGGRGDRGPSGDPGSDRGGGSAPGPPPLPSGGGNRCMGPGGRPCCAEPRRRRTPQAGWG